MFTRRSYLFRNLSKLQFVDKQLHKRLFTFVPSSPNLPSGPQFFNSPTSTYNSTQRTFSTNTIKMAPSKDEKDKVKSEGHHESDVEGEHNEWKFKEPYKVHENDKNFKALYNGECHCGRVKYQLSREKPLNAKFCHCTTCQVLHGPFSRPITSYHFIFRTCNWEGVWNGVWGYGADDGQVHSSNGQRSSRKAISTSPTDTMI